MRANKVLANQKSHVIRMSANGNFMHGFLAPRNRRTNNAAIRNVQRLSLAHRIQRSQKITAYDRGLMYAYAIQF